MKTKNIFNIFSVSLILFTIATWGSSCAAGDSSWEKGAERDVVKNGISFTIFREYPDGTKIGTMTEDTVINGWPCAKKLISFYPEWELDAVTLFEDYECNGVSMPAGTRVLVNLDGNPQRCVFPHAVEIQSHLVRGCWNVYTVNITDSRDEPRASFYRSGKLKEFTIKGREVIDGVTCKYQALLYENGRLQYCELAKPAKIEVDGFPVGVVCEKGQIHFYQTGQLGSCRLAEPYKIGDKEIPEGTDISFDPSGTVTIYPVMSRWQMDHEALGEATILDPTGKVIGKIVGPDNVIIKVSE